MRQLSAVLLCSALMFVAACGGNSRLGSRYVKSVPVTASEGATITVDAAEEPALDKAKLVIPPGALKEDTVITIEVGESDITGGRAGSVAIFGPSGLVFEKPATMTLPYQLNAGQLDSTLFVSVQEEDGRRSVVRNNALTIDTANRTVSFSVNGFTSFQPASGNLQGDGGVVSCQADVDCAQGDFCVNGACQTPFDGGSAPTCVSDSDCTSAGDRCFNGYCQSSPNMCTTNASCAAGEQCVNGYCTPGQTDAGFGLACNSNAVCPAGQVCVGGNCMASDAGFSCAMDSDCAAGESCVNGACYANAQDAGFFQCSIDTDCGTGEVCVNGACYSNAQDAGSFQCSMDSDCGASEVCISGACYPIGTDGGAFQCAGDTDCATGESCVNGACYPGGSADGGSNVLDGGLGLACVSDANCPNQQQCVFGVCQ